MKSSRKTVPPSQTPAHLAYLRGDYNEAINLQVAAVNRLVNSGEKPVTERKLLGLYLYSAGDCGAAIEILKIVEPLVPDDSEIPENIGIMLRQSGNLKAAVRYLEKAHTMSPEKPNICDGLAHCFGNLREEEKSQHFGRLSLRLKDALAAKSPHVFPIPEENPPPISCDNPAENVISFSLWGENPRYLRGAVRNARLAPDIYPDWTCRFYVDDSVPIATISELETLGASIIRMPAPDPFYEGLLWRFRVIGDPSVKRYLVRDCDSVINVKERVAVDEWLASDKWFHMMRDFISHTEMILAGMFGGVNGEFGPLPDVATLRDQFRTDTAPTRTYDQHFLREMVWPTMRQSVLIHDSVYADELGSVPFPAVGKLGPRKHIGQNEAAIAEFAETAEKIVATPSGRQPFFVFGLNKSGTTFLQSLIDAHPNANCPSEHSLNTVKDTLDQQINGYRRVVEDFDRKTSQQGVRLDSERMHKVLYRTWIDELMNTGVTEATTHIGLNDNCLAENLPEHFELFPDAKFLYIVRDPRDVAVSVWHHRLRTESRFAKSGIMLDDIAKAVAEKWLEYLEAVSKMARNHRGSIEMVRFEDLVAPRRRDVTARNALNFLRLDSSPEIIAEMFSMTDEAKNSDQGQRNGFYRTAGVKSTWQGEMTASQIEKIESMVGHRMKTLRYKLSEELNEESEATFNRNVHPENVRERHTEESTDDVVLSA